MLNVPELERRWLRYRRSKRQPYFIAGGVTAVAIAGILYGLFTYDSSEAPALAQKTEKPEKKTQPEQHAVAPAPQTVSEAVLPPATSAPAAAPKQPQAPALAEQPVAPTPEMPLMHEFESDVMEYYRNTTPAPIMQKRVSTEQPRTAPKKAPIAAPQTKPAAVSAEKAPSAAPAEPRAETPKASAAVTEAPSPAANVEPQKQDALPSIRRANTSEQRIDDTPASDVITEKPAVSERQSAPEQMRIQHESDMQDIQDVIARFKKNKSPVLSLFIAKTYYRIGNYQEAYNYALITNEIDSSIEDSWLVFAESLYKLDQKEMAKKTLKSYIQESSSVKAKIILDQMVKGTFE